MQYACIAYAVQQVTSYGTAYDYCLLVQSDLYFVKKVYLNVCAIGVVPDETGTICMGGTNVFRLYGVGDTTDGTNNLVPLDHL